MSDFDTIREALQSAPEYVTPGGLKHCPARDALSRVQAAAEQAEKALAGIQTTCREGGNRCRQPAEFLLWGKLLPNEGLGPRCYDHAAKWAGHRALGDPAWAILDLRPGSAALAVLRGKDTLLALASPDPKEGT